MKHACPWQAARQLGVEVWGGLVALLVFKTSVGLNKVPGGFDSHPPPPISLFWFLILISSVRFVIGLI